MIRSIIATSIWGMIRLSLNLISPHSNSSIFLSPSQLGDERRLKHLNPNHTRATSYGMQAERSPPTSKNVQMAWSKARQCSSLALEAVCQALYAPSMTPSKWSWRTIPIPILWKTCAIMSHTAHSYPILVISMQKFVFLKLLVHVSRLLDQATGEFN